MQGARRGTRSRASRITPQAAGGDKPLRHRGCPLLSSLKHALHLGVPLLNKISQVRRDLVHGEGGKERWMMKVIVHSIAVKML